MQTDDAIDIVRDSATSVLEQVYLGNTVRNWLIAAVVFAATLGALMLVRWLVVRKLATLADRTRTHLDEYVVALLRHTRYGFLVLLALAPALAVLVLPERISDLVTPLFRLVVIIQVGLWIGELVTLHLQNLTTRRAATDVASVTTIRAIGLLVRLLLWMVIFLLVLKNFGVDVTALLTTLGIAGIAAALAVQNILGDLLASLSIVLDKPFVVGDFIVVDQYSGTVEEIGLKTTRIRSLSGERLVFSNADLLRSRIRNYRDMTRRRIVFSFGVEYGTSRDVLERIPEVVRDTITAIEQTSFDRCHFQKFGDSSLDFETVYFVLVPDYNRYMDIQQRINLELYDRLTALGTGFAFPTRTLIVESGEGPGARRTGLEPLANAALPGPHRA
ncbi:MAG: mechanosensitive ion channel family protein [Gemmatimonadaceae bacterium]